MCNMHIYVHTVYGVCVILYPPPQQHGPEETHGSQTRNIHRSGRASHPASVWISASLQGSSITEAALGSQLLKSNVRTRPCPRRGQKIHQWFQVPSRDVSDQAPDHREGAEAASGTGHCGAPPSALPGGRLLSSLWSL